jgi:multiple sugar transport system ATP-binding protein
MATIELRRIEKDFGAMRVLSAIDLSIADGEFLVLVGPSGCGKSTLLRIIAGLEQPSGGEILIDGRDVTDVPSKSRDIAMVFQSYALYPHMTVAENMGFSLRVRGVDKATIETRVAAAAESLNLTPYLARKPAALSGGQRQRVAMGRAIVRDPKVFLFDEPLSNLDAKLRVSMRTEIKALHQKLKTTTVYVTHDQVEAMTMADRIVVLRDGRIEQIGSPLELYDRPVNTFVAEFIGSPAMNLLPGMVRGGEAAIDGGSRLALPRGIAGADGRRIVVGVRPEHLEIASGGGLVARVETVEPTGAQVQVVGTLGDRMVTAVFNGRVMPQVGSEIRLAAAAEHLHAFDAETGARVGA